MPLATSEQVVAPVRRQDGRSPAPLTARLRGFARRRRVPITVVGSLATAALLAVALAGRRHEFEAALSAVAPWLLVDLDAALLFAANEIAEVRELADEVRRERARVGAYAARDHARGSLERYQQMRLREYHASLAMLLAVAPQHRLVRQLANELDGCPISVRRAKHVSAGR
jgi:hypothetical protein